MLVGALALFLLLAASYTLSINLRATRAASITGDEPFYLLTTQSLLQDGNLDLQRQYATESYRSFFDHPEGLWKQSVVTNEGRLLSPHEPGLSVLLLPGFAAGELRGAQVEMLLIAALTFALGFLLVARETGKSAIAWLVTAAIGLSATPFVYATDIYPEVPAALCLMLALLLLQRKLGSKDENGRFSTIDGLMLVLLVSALAWLSMKYVPLGLLLALPYLYRTGWRQRLLFVILGATSAALYVWFHYAMFDDLTAYSVNTVYEGANAVNVLESHISFGDRFYRLWGLLVDRRFGVGRWAPLLLLLPASLPLLLRAGSTARLVLGLIVVQVLIATFVAITMMGWWFPGRTLMAVLPLTALPLTLLVARLSWSGRLLAAALAGVSLAFTLALRNAASAGDVRLAVDPFDMDWAPFYAVARLFPNYQTWSGETIALTAVWLAILLSSMAFVILREHGSLLPRWQVLPRIPRAPGLKRA